MITSSDALDALAPRIIEVGRICGVYLLILRGEVIYVGSSINVSTRVLGHRCAKSFDRAVWIPVDKDDLTSYEGALIRALRPSLNWGANVSYLGNDNDVLTALGLPVHDDERAVAANWRAEFKRRRVEQLRVTRDRGST